MQQVTCPLHADAHYHSNSHHQDRSTMRRQYSTLITMTAFLSMTLYASGLHHPNADAHYHSNSHHHDCLTMCRQQSTLITMHTAISMTLYADGLHHPSADAPHHNDVLIMTAHHHDAIPTPLLITVMPSLLPAHPSDICPIHSIPLYYASVYIRHQAGGYQARQAA